MQTMIVYVDDATYAQKILSPLLPAADAQAAAPTKHWIVVSCAPRVTNDVSKWVSQEALELWRGDWAKATFDQLTPLLQTTGNKVTSQLASLKGTLIEQTALLTKQHAGAQVLDARRPKFGQDLEPITLAQPKDHNRVAGLAAAIGAASVLAADF